MTFKVEGKTGILLNIIKQFTHLSFLNEINPFIPVFLHQNLFPKHWLIFFKFEFNYSKIHSFKLCRLIAVYSYLTNIYEMSVKANKTPSFWSVVKECFTPGTLFVCMKWLSVRLKLCLKGQGRECPISTETCRDTLCL